MRKVVSSLFLFGLISGVAVSKAQAADRISAPISGLSNNNGVVRCGLYDSPDAFPKAGQESRGVIAKIRGGQAVCVFRALRPGTYAIAAFHAQNNETQMQYGLFGRPREEYGFSRNPSSTWGAPTFGAASFDYRGGVQTVPIRLNY